MLQNPALTTPIGFTKSAANTRDFLKITGFLLPDLLRDHHVRSDAGT